MHNHSAAMLLGFLKRLYFCKEINFSSQKIFEKISMTENYFFYKNKIALTSPTHCLKKDFAHFGEQIGRAIKALFQCIYVDNLIFLRPIDLQ